MTRPFASVEHWEHRDDRSPADQAGGGIVHPNGTLIVSGSVEFLGACLREILVLNGCAMNEAA